ncbi:hypothetical protein DXG01_007167 [Tephrocybe rancida]|nr:hypothetical protein DXG01_007167 [Tephrocybe rancida]
MESSSQVVPNIFKTRHASFTLEVYHENSLTPKVVDTFIQATFGDVIGLAPTYGSKRALTTLALFNGTKALLVRFPSSKAKPKQVSPGRALLQRLLLTPLRKLAFKMDILATALYKDIGLHTNRGVDLLSVSTTDARCSTNALMFVLGGEVMLNKATVVELFTQEETQTPDLSNTALQAWAAYQAAYLERTSKLLVSSAEVVTTALDRKHLILVTNVIRDAACLVALKPMRQKNEIGNDYSHKQGKLEVKSVRFKTRLMQNRNANQVIEIQSTNDKRVSAKLTKVNGRAASLALRGPLSGRIQSVTTVGREPLTKAEEIRGLIALKVLTGSSQIMEYQFVRRIWRLSKNISWDGLPSLDGPVAISFPGRTLNASQLKSVTAILSKNDNDRITLIQGPPGTGKTTVIAAAITSVIASADPERTIWVVAQSNVAVKNVAEKLADVSFLDFKILVSKDFHFDWHEHLYHEIEGNVIRSDDMQASIVSTERLLLGSRIILCTLSMLSHDRLTPYVHLVPPQTIIVDEASQIEVGDYLPPLQRFRATLCKLVFIGDNKQLAPYGRSDIPGLHSIFEMSHLQNRAIFLDTQCQALYHITE